MSVVSRVHLMDTKRLNVLMKVPSLNRAVVQLSMKAASVVKGMFITSEGIGF